MSAFEPTDLTAARRDISTLRARVNQLENEASQRRLDDSARRDELDRREAALAIKARAIDEFLRALRNVENYVRTPGV